jgi:hypothetical protein
MLGFALRLVFRRNWLWLVEFGIRNGGRNRGLQWLDNERVQRFADLHDWLLFAGSVLHEPRPRSLPQLLGSAGAMAGEVEVFNF